MSSRPAPGLCRKLRVSQGYIVCVYVCWCRGVLLACIPQQDNFVELVLSFHLHMVSDY